MAWRVAKVEEHRKEFIEKVYEDERTIVELCEEFQISRTTAYKWIQRYQKEGEVGLKDKSRAPHTQPNKTEESQYERVLEIKHQYSNWGSKKILARLKMLYPNELWPSETTIGNILEKNGLVNRKKIRRKLAEKSDPLSHCNAPNDVWSVDFKGWFLTKDGIKCDPLTVSDAYSRFILECTKLPSNNETEVWQSFERLFYEYGLPKYLRHDNGSPFATTGAGRLSKLSVKLIKAGVIPEWIDPGKPYQNGRHERMHRTLKADGVLPYELTLEEQQMKFKEFMNYFNQERPHEALQQRVPGSVYVPSNRIWDGCLHTPEYNEDYLVKRITERGQIFWYGADIYIGKTLKNEHVGILQEDDLEWSVYFGPVYLGFIDMNKNFVLPMHSNRVKRNFKVRCY